MSDTNEKKKSHGFLKVSIFLIILGFCIFGIAKFVQYQKANLQVDGQGTIQGNSDGNSKLFSRSANNNDIAVNNELDLSSFGGKYIIIPQTDINGLELTVNFLDSNKTILTSVVKSLGNVKEGVQISFSISLFDMGLSIAWNTKYESIVVTGGTVSYFA